MPKAYVVQDQYFKKAKEQGYRARSAFKLLEINDKFHVFKKGQQVLDLGSAPGSWLQVIGQQVGAPLVADSEQSRGVGAAGKAKPEIIGIDLQEIEALPGVDIFQADITNFERLNKILGPSKFDVITADLAPKTSGMKDVDQYRSVELNLAVLEVAKKFLKTPGIVVTKVFVGEDFADLIKEYKRFFKQVKNFKPDACRDRSFETYLVCKR